MKDIERARLKEEILFALDHFNINDTPLRGIQSHNRKNAFAEQIIDSIRRVTYVEKIAQTPVSKAFSDPTRNIFDPLKAAIYFKNQGNFEEACWLVFLAIHCGKSTQTGWLLTRELYGLIDPISVRTWNRIGNRAGSFTNWLTAHQHLIQGKFGNHRKYESLDTRKRMHTGLVIDSYIDWIAENGNHQEFFKTVLQECDDSPTKAFSKLYTSMNRVIRFGRTGKFDYLTMLAKLELVRVEPEKAYFSNATGPKKGVRKLIMNNGSFPLPAQQAEEIVNRLGAQLPIPSMVLQVMEDAICNWQKNPETHIYFRG